MLKVGDWIEIKDTKANLMLEKSRYQKVKEIFYEQNNIYDLSFYSGKSTLMTKNDFRVLTPEEVKAKGLDEKSDFVPHEPNDCVKTASQSKNRKPKQPYTKFLFVEDGSVDTDSLEKDLRKRNPEIKIVVYRQGAAMPHLVDIKELK